MIILFNARINFEVIDFAATDIFWLICDMRKF